LLEVLVAFTVLAISLGVLFQIFSTGMRASRSAEEYTRATLLAEGNWYFYMTSTVSADWVIASSDTVDIRHWPTFASATNDAGGGYDYDRAAPLAYVPGGGGAGPAPACEQRRGGCGPGRQSLPTRPSTV